MPSFTLAQIQCHQSESSCWVIWKDKVYDVTNFMQDHPGGAAELLAFAGSDVTNVLLDEDRHAHSDAAFDLLEDYYIGDLDRAGLPDAKDAKKETGKATWTTNEFLDLRKPMFPQLWKATYSKAFYLQEVHKPRHVSHYVPYFGHPWLDMLSKTAWYVVPLVWLPFVCLEIWRSLYAPQSSLVLTCKGVIGGMLFWTLFEYIMHRGLFHLDDLLPDHPMALLVHFTLHGIHHHMPMDRLRLVMPPALTALLSIPVFKLAHSLFETTVAHAFVAGAFLGYIGYDMTHYYLHHARVMEWHFKEMKRYHLAHHYKNYESGFGITSKLWDHVFGTLLVQRSHNPVRQET